MEKESWMRRKRRMWKKKKKKTMMVEMNMEKSFDY